MTSNNEEMRFEFGRNWHGFVKKNFTQERCDTAKQRILKFIDRADTKGLDFLDIGCGSGLHSLAAWQAGANKIHSFDYDANSVAATTLLWEKAGKPSNWKIERGDALNKDYVASLGKWGFVYSWGVLHHTGQMWQAIENAQSTVAPGGQFYIALYSSDADFQPSKEFWLEVKQKYNRSSALGKERMVYWYIWRFMMQKDWKRAKEVIDRAITYKTQRGMDLLADIRDWLGGWPMEYAGDQETVDFLKKFGFSMTNADTGQACSEFLFVRDGAPAPATSVKEFMAAKRAAAEAEKAANEAHAATSTAA